MVKHRHHPKAADVMVEALKSCRKMWVAGEDGGAGIRSKAWPSE